MFLNHGSAFGQSNYYYCNYYMKQNVWNRFFQYLTKTASKIFPPLIIISFLLFIVSNPNLSLRKAFNVSDSGNEKFTFKSPLRITGRLLFINVCLSFSFPLTLEYCTLVVVSSRASLCSRCTKRKLSSATHSVTFYSLSTKVLKV